MKQLIKFSTIIAFSILALLGCKKLTEVGVPKNQITNGTVFTDSTTAQSALVNIYALFANTIDGTYNPNVSLYSDEMSYSSTPVQTVEFYHSLLSAGNTSNLNIWANLYYIIYSCNDLINELHQSANLTRSTINQYIGEAKFLRAFAYFYLTNLYGAVPLVLETDVAQTSTLARSDSATIYNQMIGDLKDAQSSLTTSYPGGQKIRANQFCATALLARIFLYQKKWPEAENAANLILNSGLYTPLESPTNVFLANSTETILQFGTPYGFIPSTPIIIPRSGKPVYTTSPTLLNAFEPDLRKANWIGITTVSKATYYYPFKYKNRAANTTSPENLMAIRAGEVYLIRAEARIMQNNIAGCQADINVIRSRAGLGNTIANTVLSLQTAILHERQVELFNEWGHRLLDLKRLGQANAVLKAVKPTWVPNTSLLFPVPQYELTHDANLIQNPGY